MFNRLSNPKFGNVSNTGFVPPEYSGGSLITISGSQPMQFEPINFPYLSPQIPVIMTQNPNNYTVSCECLHGTPIIKSDGSCGCVVTADNNTTSKVDTPVNNTTSKNDTIYYITGNQNQTDIIKTIKDNPVIFGALAIGLILLITNK